MGESGWLTRYFTPLEMQRTNMLLILIADNIAAVYVVSTKRSALFLLLLSLFRPPSCIVMEICLKSVLG